MGKIILGIIIGIFVSMGLFLVTPALATQTGRLIAELEGRNIFGEGVKVSKIADGKNECYVATAVQQTGDWALRGTMIAISCLKVK